MSRLSTTETLKGRKWADVELLMPYHHYCHNQPHSSTAQKDLRDRHNTLSSANLTSPLTQLLLLLNSL